MQGIFLKNKIKELSDEIESLEKFKKSQNIFKKNPMTVKLARMIEKRMGELKDERKRLQEGFYNGKYVL